MPWRERQTADLWGCAMAAAGGFFDCAVQKLPFRHPEKGANEMGFSTRVDPNQPEKSMTCL